MWQLMLNVSVIDVQRKPKCAHPFVQTVYVACVCVWFKQVIIQNCISKQFYPTEWALFFMFVVCSVGTLNSSSSFDSVLVSQGLIL